MLVPCDFENAAPSRDTCLISRRWDAIPSVCVKWAKNSRITYSYQDTLVSQQLAQMFKLNGETGIITTGEELDFEKQQQHILYIRSIVYWPTAASTELDS